MNTNEHEGDVVIKKGGYHPEMGLSYEYISKQHHFWFYCFMKLDGRIRRVTITDATPKNFEGMTKKFDRDDVAKITEDMQKYFLGMSANEIIFTWKVEK